MQNTESTIALLSLTYSFCFQLEHFNLTSTCRTLQFILLDWQTDVEKPHTVLPKHTSIGQHAEHTTLLTLIAPDWWHVPLIGLCIHACFAPLVWFENWFWYDSKTVTRHELFPLHRAAHACLLIDVLASNLHQEELQNRTRQSVTQRMTGTPH